MYANKVKFLSYVPGSIRTNVYGFHPYREIALIDVVAEFRRVEQICTLPFYRSSGRNSGKQRGQWYPVLGIKEHDGEFDELGDWVNVLMNKLLPKGAEDGWLVKSLFFEPPVKYGSESAIPVEMQSLRGHGYTSHGYFLKEVAEYIKQEFD